MAVMVNDAQGATESNNIAIKGIARFYREHKTHVITAQTVCAVTAFPLAFASLRLHLAITHRTLHVLRRSTNVCWTPVAGWR